MSETERVKLYIEDGAIAIEVDGETIWEDFLELDGALLSVDGREWTVGEVSRRLGHEVGSWSRAQATELGRALERLLFHEDPPPEITRALVPAAGRAVRLELHLDDYSAPVPWEYLCLGGRRLAGQGVSFVRHVEHLRPRPLSLPESLDRVELAYANPPRADDGAYDADSHLKGLCNAIDDIFGVRLVPRCTAADIRRALSRRPNGPPFIFHFLGHGLPTGLEVHRSDTSQRMECLEAAVLAQWIATAPVAAVILGACESGAAGTHAMRGVAETIVAQTGVPVLAMQTVVSQAFSTGYLVELYRLLANEGESFEGAIDRARHAISRDDTHALGIPVLYSDVVHEPQPYDPSSDGRWSPSPKMLEADLDTLQQIASRPGPKARLAPRHGPDRSPRSTGGTTRDHLVAQRSGPTLALGAATAGSPVPVEPSLVNHARTLDWPESPYPLLGAYDDPRLLGGRARERAILRRKLNRAPILGVFAVSGAGKSSLLRAGLLADLRLAGITAVFSAKPHERPIAQRLIDELLEPAPTITSAVDFEEAIEQVHRLAGHPPVLILDQFEELFKEPTGLARARVGPLLAATMRKSEHGPLCRWVISYRREFHGDVRDWLADVLAEADAHGVPRGDWPHNLATSDRFADWSLPLFGAPPPGDRGAKGAEEAFYEAIMLPVEQAGTPWRLQIEPYDARRLAAEFAAARIAHPRDPLVPELQVVLARLLDAGGGWQMRVPEVVGDLLNDALTHHAEQAINAAIPLRRDGSARRQRGLVWTALSRLVDEHGRRAAARRNTELAEIIGEDGERVLESLSSSRTRLLVGEITEDGHLYGLSHDRLAQVIAKAVVRRSDVVSEPALLALDEFIRRRAELHASGDPGALDLGRHYRSVRANPELRTSEARAAWWGACARLHRRKSRRRLMRAVVALLFVAGLAGAAQVFESNAAADKRQAEQRAREAEIVRQFEAANDAEVLTQLVNLRLTGELSSALRGAIFDALGARDPAFWRDLLGHTVLPDPLAVAAHGD